MQEKENAVSPLPCNLLSQALCTDLPILQLLRPRSALVQVNRAVSRPNRQALPSAIQLASDLRRAE